VAPLCACAQFGERLWIDAVLRGDETGEIVSHVLEMVAKRLDATPIQVDTLMIEEKDGA
jgi:hypothetical protein